MSTRFKPYPSYKDSGVEWLGRIPGHWQVKRLKFLASQPLAYGANESAELNDPSQPRFIRITDVRSDGSLHEDTFRSLPEAVAKPFLLRQGDLLFARSGATVGKTFMYRESWGRACHAGYLIRCRLNVITADPEFVSYFATSSAYWGWLSSVFIQATIQNVSAEKYGNLIVPWPTLNQQQAIAAFLTKETGKIDALVKKKERLIELLQEKRIALISHAVTQGLNPNVPKKDSGIPWLRQIPKHWACAPVYARYHVQLGKMLDTARITGQHLAPYLRNIDVQWDRVNVEGLPQMDFLPDDRQRFSLRAGDLLVCEGGEVGRAAIWCSELPECYYQKAVHRLRPISAEDEPRFMFYLLFHASKLGVFIAGGNANTIDHLTADKLRKHRFAFPPHSEQVSVLGHLDQ